MSERVISMVKCATDTETRDISVEKVLEGIRRGGKDLKGQIVRIRNKFEAELAFTSDREKAKLAVAPLKKQLPGVMWCGQFCNREQPAADKLQKHSGLFIADLDGLGDKLPGIRKKLEASPHVFVFFLSPSGDGLKVVIRVPADVTKHAGSFRAVAQHVRELTGVQIDESGKDVSRLCFMSYDPELYHNPDATELEPLPEPEKPKASVSRSCEGNSKPSKAEVREMLAVIPKRPEYHDWIKLVAAVGDALSDDEAIELLNEWSPEELPNEYAKKLASGFEKIHVGTLIHLARQHGWTPVDQATTAQSEPENAIFARLATLSPTQYDRCRKDEAKRLRIRSASLDAEVAARRPHIDVGRQGSAVEFPDVVLWETPVNGADVLSEIAATFSRYLALPAGAADVLALWTAHAHAFEAFVHTPRLNLCSPDKGCGKTTALDVLASVIPRPLRTESMTAAVLFRLVEQYKPTLLLDEVDAYLNEAEELRGLLNAGHKRGAKAYRCEGENNTVRGFAAFAPAALAGIGALPGTLHDRAIVVRLGRAKPGEVAARFDSRRTEGETELCRKLARWNADNFDRLQSCDPQLPETAFNRLADNWRPLFAIAQVAGNAWPQRAHTAFVALTSSADLDAQGVGTLLLSDIAVIFAAGDRKDRDKLPSLEESLAAIEAGEAVDKLPSAQLASKLSEIEGRPWAEWGRQRKPISPNQLANQLRRFGISPRGIRVGDETPRGYMLDDFKEAFSRYLPKTLLSDCNTATTLGKTSISEVQQAESVLHPEKAASQSECCSVAPQKGVVRENKEVSSDFDESDTIQKGTYEL